MDILSSMFTCISSSSICSSFRLARLSVYQRELASCLEDTPLLGHNRLLSTSLFVILMVPLLLVCGELSLGAYGQSDPQTFCLECTLNFYVLNTIASISFSIGAQLISDSQSLRDT